MKQFLIFLSIIVTVSVLTLCLMAFNRPNSSKYEQPKKYSLTLTQDQWAARMKYISNAQEIMRSSTLPGNVIAQWQDSLSLFQQEISEQIGSQIKADTTKPVKKN